MLAKRSLKQCRRAATAVETAFVLTICVILILAVFEYGRFLMIRQMVDNAAREGARQAVVGANTSASMTTIQTTVLDYLAGQPLRNTSGVPLSASDIQVYLADPATGAPAAPSSAWTNATFGSTIAVSITAVYQPMLPSFGFLPTSITMKSTVLMQSEAYGL